MHNHATPLYRRILLKLSGEALMGNEPFGIDPKVLDRLANDIRTVVRMGVQVGVVIGGGNLFRGQKLADAGMDRVAGDHMGMLATVMNSLAMQDALERAGQPTRVMSAVSLTGVCDDYDRRYAVRHLEQGCVVILCAGTGNPFFTTDTAATLRGIEIGADVILKATNVDGVYSNDPKKYPEATRYERLSYSEALERELKVMDLTAFCLARDHGKVIRVFDIHRSSALVEVVTSEDIGTVIQ
ncbi:MAG: UMP kinase [Gammaproteobacteria bacterium]|nr:MAG: UMP kinase [Gammaproteobacteria bacterium]